jgi:hypothetical protein
MSGAIFFNFGHKYVWWCTSQTDIGSCRQRHLSSLVGRCDMINRDRMGEREYGDGYRNGKITGGGDFFQNFLNHPRGV